MYFKSIDTYVEKASKIIGIFIQWHQISAKGLIADTV